MNIVIHHNPDCGTSRNVVRIIRGAGAVLDLLETWPTGPRAKEDGDLLIDEAGQRLPE
ncbi:MAG: hypothetical protein AAFP13_09715 [Pseudomonadota bacterium]